MSRETALNAKEGSLIRTIGFIDTTTGRTGSGSVAGINRNHNHACTLCFVFDKASQLVERPAMQGCSLAASSPDPVTDALQIFKGDSSSGALRRINNLLADRVVDLSGKASFFAGKLSEATTTRLRTLLLQLATQTTVAKAHVLNLTAAVQLLVAVSRNRGDTEINTEIVGWRFERGFVNVARLIQVELAIAIDKIGFALSLCQQSPVGFTTDKGDGQSPIERPDRNGVAFLPTENAVVVGDAAQRSKRPLCLPVELVAIGNFGNNANRNLRRKTELFSDGIVASVMQIVLAKLLTVPGVGAEIVRRCIRSFKCSLQAFNLCISRVQLDLRSQFHSDVFLVFDVLLDNGQWCATYGGDKVAVSPKRRKPGSAPGKFLSQVAGRTTFDTFDNDVDSQLRIDIEQQVYMVGHHFHLKDFAAQFFADLAHDFLQPFVCAIDKHFFPVLWTKDNVVMAAVGNVIVMFQTIVIAHAGYYTARSSIMRISQRVETISRLSAAFYPSP